MRNFSGGLRPAEIERRCDVWGDLVICGRGSVVRRKSSHVSIILRPPARKFPPPFLRAGEEKFRNQNKKTRVGIYRAEVFTEEGTDVRGIWAKVTGVTCTSSCAL